MQQWRYGGTRLICMKKPTRDCRHTSTLMFCNLYLFVPFICCPTSVSCPQDHFCIHSYLVCPSSYSVLFQWKLSSTECWPFLSPLHQSTDLWGHKWSCELWGPALAQIFHWFGASMFSMQQNWLLGALRLLCLRAFYSMNTPVSFSKDTILMKVSIFASTH